MMAKCKTRGSKALKHCYKELEMLLEDDETQTHVIRNLVKMADVAGEEFYKSASHASHASRQSKC